MANPLASVMKVVGGAKNVAGAVSSKLQNSSMSKMASGMKSMTKTAMATNTAINRLAKTMSTTNKRTFADIEESKERFAVEGKRWETLFDYLEKILKGMTGSSKGNGKGFVDALLSGLASLLGGLLGGLPLAIATMLKKILNKGKGEVEKATKSEGKGEGESKEAKEAREAEKAKDKAKAEAERATEKALKATTEAETAREATEKTRAEYEKAKGEANKTGIEAENTRKALHEAEKATNTAKTEGEKSKLTTAEAEARTQSEIAEGKDQTAREKVDTTGKAAQDAVKNEAKANSIEAKEGIKSIDAVEAAQSAPRIDTPQITEAKAEVTKAKQALDTVRITDRPITADAMDTRIAEAKANVTKAEVNLMNAEKTTTEATRAPTEATGKPSRGIRAKAGGFGAMAGAFTALELGMGMIKSGGEIPNQEQVAGAISGNVAGLAAFELGGAAITAGATAAFGATGAAGAGLLLGPGMAIIMSGMLANEIGNMMRDTEKMKQFSEEMGSHDKYVVGLQERLQKNPEDKDAKEGLLAFSQYGKDYYSAMSKAVDIDAGWGSIVGAQGLFHGDSAEAWAKLPNPGDYMIDKVNETGNVGPGKMVSAASKKETESRAHDALYTALLGEDISAYMGSIKGVGQTIIDRATGAVTLGMISGGQTEEASEIFKENLSELIGGFLGLPEEQRPPINMTTFRDDLTQRFEHETKASLMNTFRNHPTVQAERDENQKKLNKTREAAPNDRRSGANKGGVVPSGIKGDIPINVHAAEAILPLQGTYAHDSASLIGQGLLQPLVQWASSKMSGQLHSATMSRTSGSSSPPVMISNDNRSYSSGGGGKGAYPSVNSGPSIAGYEELFAKMTGVYAKGARV